VFRCDSTSPPSDPPWNTVNVRFRSLRMSALKRSERAVHAACINMRELCNQSRRLSVTLRSKRVARVTTIFTTTLEPFAQSSRLPASSGQRELSRRKSRGMCIDAGSHVRKSFTRLAKISVNPYTCSECTTNCRDAQTTSREGTRKPQLTSCIYVANLMQLRRCEWRYVACAPPRNRFRQG
jgi:hypothetical protein